MAGPNTLTGEENPVPRLFPKRGHEYGPGPVPKGVPAGAWPQPSGPRTDPQPITRSVPRHEFYLATNSFHVGWHYFAEGALYRKDNPIIADIARKNPDLLIPATPD
jgi:hypothetical protein